MDAETLRSRLAAGVAPIVLDVRSRGEFASGHIPGARHVPVWEIWRRAPAMLPDRNTPVVVYCGHGPRARLASILLRLRGYRRLACLDGHMSGWRRAGFAIDREAP